MICITWVLVTLVATIFRFWRRLLWLDFWKRSRSYVSPPKIRTTRYPETVSDATWVTSPIEF